MGKIFSYDKMIKDNMIPTDKNYQRAVYFFENKIQIHIKKSNGTYLNGFLNKVDLKTIRIEDRFLGEQTVFFFDIVGEITEFTNKNRVVER